MEKKHSEAKGKERKGKEKDAKGRQGEQREGRKRIGIGENRKGKGSEINERTPKQTATTETNVTKLRVVTSAVSSAQR